MKVFPIAKQVSAVNQWLKALSRSLINSIWQTDIVYGLHWSAWSKKKKSVGQPTMERHEQINCTHSERSIAFRGGYELTRPHLFKR